MLPDLKPNSTFLTGIRLLSLAINIPGPVAVARLRQMGATITKIEPPTGDPLKRIAPIWYEILHEDVTVLSLDLKEPVTRSILHSLLAETDILLTSMRPSALERLGLAWQSLSNSYPQLCQVAIVGYPTPKTEKAGHDLTYQADLGLVQPPQIPRTLLADLAGAERAVTTAVALLFARSRQQKGGYQEVALAEAAALFGHPWNYGITQPNGVLGGAFAGYRMYATLDGWIAVAALEPHFWQRICRILAVEGTVEELTTIFSRRSTADWVEWAEQYDLPLTAVH